MAHCLNKGVEAELRGIAGNNVCCDCDSKSPQWASVSFGVFMCLECSGRHRSLGVHVSFVRSVSMDSWSEKQIQMMRTGGNNKCNSFLQQHGVAKETPIPNKYNSPAAQLFRDRLLAEVEGRPLPTELPKATSNATQGGTDPLPGESEEQYVARQKRLQAEARERLKAKFGASNGLTSGGKSAMTGIGSDSSYKPGGSSSGPGGGGGGILGGIKTEEVTAQLAEASQKAVSWLSTGIATIGERVGKAKEELLKPAPVKSSTSSYLSQDSYGNDDERSMGFHGNTSITMGVSKSGGGGFERDRDSSNNSPPRTQSQSSAPSASFGSSYTAGSNGNVTGTGTGAGAGDKNAATKEALNKGWSMLAAGAADLWAKAAEATNEIIKNVVEEDDTRFPRPPGSDAPLSNNGAPPVGNGGNSSISGSGSGSVSSVSSGGSGGNEKRPATLPPPQSRSFHSPRAEDMDDREAEKKKAGKTDFGLSGALGLSGLGSGQKKKKNEPLANAINSDDDDEGLYNCSLLCFSNLRFCFCFIYRAGQIPTSILSFFTSLSNSISPTLFDRCVVETVGIEKEGSGPSSQRSVPDCQKGRASSDSSSSCLSRCRAPLPQSRR